MLRNCCFSCTHSSVSTEWVFLFGAQEVGEVFCSQFGGGHSQSPGYMLTKWTEEASGLGSCSLPSSVPARDSCPALQLCYYALSCPAIQLCCYALSCPAIQLCYYALPNSAPGACAIVLMGDPMDLIPPNLSIGTFLNRPTSRYFYRGGN